MKKPYHIEIAVSKTGYMESFICDNNHSPVADFISIGFNLHTKKEVIKKIKSWIIISGNFWLVRTTDVIFYDI